MYWLQCATKPIIYVLRSPRCMNCQCGRYLDEMTNESSTTCFSRDRSHVYGVRDDGLENTVPYISELVGGFHLFYVQIMSSTIFSRSPLIWLP